MGRTAESIVGTVLVLAWLMWHLTHLGQSPDRVTDVLVVVAVVGSLLVLHSAYRNARDWHRR